MRTDFNITDIDGILFVDANKHTNHITDFSHTLQNNELIYIFSGSSKVYFNETVLNESEGYLRFLPAGPANPYKVVLPKGAAKGAECIDIFFKTDVPVSPAAFCENYKSNKVLPELFKKIFTIWTAKNPGYYHECLALLYKIFAETEKASSYISGKKYAHITPAVEYINKNFTKPNISCKEIAKLCDVSYSYIKRIFKEKFNVPPEKYIMHLKLNYACDLLKSGRYTVKEVSDMAGFTDPNYFSRCFKQNIGIAPSKYIK